MKMILIEDWYAPEFRVALNPAKCPANVNRRRLSLTPLFRPNHTACRHESFPSVRRRNRFVALQPA